MVIIEVVSFVVDAKLDIGLVFRTAFAPLRLPGIRKRFFGQQTRCLIRPTAQQFVFAYAQGFCQAGCFGCGLGGCSLSRFACSMHAANDIKGCSETYLTIRSLCCRWYSLRYISVGGWFIVVHGFAKKNSVQSGSVRSIKSANTPIMTLFRLCLNPYYAGSETIRVLQFLTGDFFNKRWLFKFI